MTKAQEARRDAELCAGLAQECRMAIWKHLGAKGPTPVTELADAIGWTQPLTSHHLAKMKASGLVTKTRDGVQIFYAQDAAAVKRLGTLFRGKKKK